ncbi:nucleotidyl transferase [Helicosporidium sp. ATCC 50920]|nr:nucleotidyl transferase [Helicosporidium sp. ATCC 50920]|eukprot:KDD73060.1 nucleotidyl transferase [Helicosporidium sp. ATCC 50920]
MPAVPLGTCLKMVDIPINNCMSAGINKIYVLTQFQSQVLNSYITNSYPPLRFGGPDRQSWVDVLAAQQTSTEKEWYQGSADAVRRNVAELMDEARGVTPATDYVILSGAAVYNMDVAALIAAHRDKGADITIAMHAVSRAEAGSKGIAKVDPSSGRVLKFEEKPPPESLDRMRRELSPPGREEYLANMGIYVFKRQALFRLLSPSKAAVITHIGHHVVPTALAQDMEVFAHQHHGYWHDVSSLKDFYEANLDLSDPRGPLHMFEVENVVMARGSILPPAHMHGAHVVDSAVGDGAVLSGCVIRRSLVGECVYVGEGSVVERSLLLGSPVWSSDAVRARARAEGGRVYGVGRGCLLRGCIVDENATVGDDVKIVNVGGVQEADRAEDEGYMIQDGIVVVMRNSIIPDGKVI